MSKPKGKSQTKTRDHRTTGKYGGNTITETAIPGAILSNEECEELLKMSVEEMESKLKETFQLEAKFDLKSAAILDYYVGATYWAKQQHHNPRQCSAFFKIAYNLLDKIKDEKLSFVDLFMEFRHMLTEIGTCDEESKVFNNIQTKAIMDYISISLFQHYKLYQFLFSRNQTEEIITMEMPVLTPLGLDSPFPFSLIEGLPEEIYTTYVEPPEPDVEIPLDTEEDKTVSIELPSNAADIFAKLSPEDVKRIINEVSASVFGKLQEGLEKKMFEEETEALKKFNQISATSCSSSKGGLRKSTDSSPTPGRSSHSSRRPSKSVVSSPRPSKSVISSPRPRKSADSSSRPRKSTD